MEQALDEAQDFQTPPEFLHLVRLVFGGPIGLDPCTVASNPTRANNFYTPAENGLAHPWIGLGPVFMNPPYGREISAWTERLWVSVAGNGNEEALVLLPARTDTKWWHRDIASADAVCFLKGRVRFVDPVTGFQLPGAGKFPSAVPYWGPNAERFVEVFGPLGWIVRTLRINNE